MKLTSFALTLLAAFSVNVSQAQSVDEIVNKHITAIGGKEVISKIKSQVTQSNLSVMGSDLSSKTTVVAGKAFKNEADYNGQTIIMVVTPTSGWTLNPLAGMTDPQAIPQEQIVSAQSVLEIGGSLYDYKNKGHKVELIGNDKLDGVNVFKLKLVNKAGKEFTYYLDASTYYVLKIESTEKVNGSDLTATYAYSNYKKTDIGLVIPYTTVTNQGFEMTTTVDKVEFNKEIDMKIFEMPK